MAWQKWVGPFSCDQQRALSCRSCAGQVANKAVQQGCLTRAISWGWLLNAACSGRASCSSHAAALTSMVCEKRRSLGRPAAEPTEPKLSRIQSRLSSS